MTLMAWIVAWAVVTTAVVVLAYLRLVFGLHEVLGVKFGSPEQVQFYLEQQKSERRLERLDVVGITLTAVSAVLALVVLFLWEIESGGGG